MLFFSSILDPQNEFVWNNKGAALDHQGKFDEALRAYNKTIEVNPKFAEAWNNKGYILNLQGKYNQAIAAFDKAKELGYTG